MLAHSRCFGSPRAPCIRRKWQLAENQQIIGENQELMSSPDNLGLQGAASGVTEADVASLFSEARARLPFRLGGQGVRAVAENASLSSEATASLLRTARGWAMRSGRFFLVRRADVALPSSRQQVWAEACLGWLTTLGRATRPPNKGMKQTSVEHIGRSQLIPGVLRTSWR